MHQNEPAITVLASFGKEYDQIQAWHVLVGRVVTSY